AKATGGASVPPRRDLRLEALAGVVDGSIKIHCHCYRSDEILMLLGVASKHGIRVQSLQHVLEGYKVAAEIAAHGATASTFSDWWAYKVEAYDAIPYNAALMSEAGVSVSIKSDSDELIRHLNLEAAKMVKYGGLTEAQALSLVTINPARELGLQDRIGSIEVGKDGDISLFNAHPFDAFARCELAVIDGEVAFQRSPKDGKLTPRPGNHATMPGAAAEAKERLVEKLQNSRGDYAIVGATLHPVGSPDIPDGTLVISEGKIAAIGEGLSAPKDVTVIDATGLVAMPGIIDTHSHIAIQGGVNEGSLSLVPEVRVKDVVTGDDTAIYRALAGGTTTARLLHGSA
ncbi:amidohydrolase family protein, partial [Singulisphaera rosea]